MADVTESTAFKTLVTQTTAVLLTRGLTVEPVAVHGVVRYVMETVAARMHVEAAEALRFVTPETVAERIAAAADPLIEGAHAVHSARPVRVDARTVEAPLKVAGRLLMALSQVAKTAIANADTRTADHAVDLSCEIGSAMFEGPQHDIVTVAVGVLDEAAVLIDKAAQEFAAGTWSTCPCGEQHGQQTLDAKLVPALRADADRVRRLREQAH